MNGLSPCCQTNTRPCVTYPLMDITNRQFSSRYTLNSPTLSAYTFKISSACCVPPPISKPIGFSKHFTQASMIWEPRPCSCSALLEPMSLSTYRKTVAPLAEALLRLCGARDAWLSKLTRRRSAHSTLGTRSWLATPSLRTQRRTSTLPQPRWLSPCRRWLRLPWLGLLRLLLSYPCPSCPSCPLHHLSCLPWFPWTYAFFASRLPSFPTCANLYT